MKTHLLPKIFILSVVVFLLSACSKKDSPTPTHPSTAPTISTLSVTQGSYNTSVVISGTNFSSTVADDKVFFNGKAATVTAATATQLTATVPLGAGTGNVTVSVKDGAVVTGPVFTYQLSYAASVLAGSSVAGEVNGTGVAAAFNLPRFIAIDAAGNLFITDSDPVVRKITPQGVVTSYAGLSKIPGNNGTVTSQQLNQPCSVAFDKDGNLLTGDAHTGIIWKITSQGSVSILKNNANAIFSFSLPEGLAVAKDGTIYMTDTFDNILYKITTQGVGTWLAGSGQQGFANGKGKAASFNSPTGVATDAAGNVYVVDGTNPHVRKITPDGTVSDFTPPAFAGAFSLAFNSTGNLFVADSSTGVISKVSSTGVVTPFAGKGSLNGVATGLTFSGLQGIAIDSNDNIYVENGNQITKIVYQ